MLAHRRAHDKNAIQLRSHAAQDLLLVREVLHAGSVVIITSRNTALLRDSCAHVEEVALLPQAQAEQLFASHAIGVEARSAAVRERAAQVVASCGGLPLTIKVRAGRNCVCHGGCLGSSAESASTLQLGAPLLNCCPLHHSCLAACRAARAP